MLPNGTRFHIDDALYSRKSTINLLSFKDISKNRYHIETMNEGNKESLYVTPLIYGKKKCCGKAHNILLWVISYDHKAN